MMFFAKALANIEDKTVAYLSICYLLTSTLISEPVRSFLNTRFLTSLLFAAPLSLIFIMILFKTGLFTHRIDRKDTCVSHNTRLSRSDLYLLLAICAVSILILFSKTLLVNPPASRDEEIHMVTTQEVFGLSLHDLLAVFSSKPHPPLFFVVMAWIFDSSKPTLMEARIATSLIASVIPLFVYLLARSLSLSRLVSVATALGYVMSIFFQNLAYRYLLDGMIALWGILSTLFFLLAIRRSRIRYSMLAAAFLALCILTYYPSALWISASFVLCFLYFHVQRKESMRHLAPILITLLVFIPLFALNFSVVSRFAWQGLIRTSPNISSYLWDLALSLGWGAHFTFLMMIGRLFRREYSVKSASTVLVAFLVLSYISTFVFGLYSRRISTIFPIIATGLVCYSQRYSKGTSTLLWTNIFWWGLLSSISTTAV